MRVNRLFGPFWFQLLQYPTRKVPLTERGNTQETEFPWRSGVCRVFRIPFTRRAVALGRWVDAQESEIVDGEPTLTFRPLPRWFDDADVQ